VIAARAREDWAGRHAVPAGELGLKGENDFAAVVRLVWPDSRAADHDQWEMLKRTVPERLARLERQQRVRERLAEVFRELVWLVEAGRREAGGRPAIAGGRPP
jgi:hypothetical protein